MLRCRFECLFSMTLNAFTLEVSHAPISVQVLVLNVMLRSRLECLL